jgi:hypothetical protein
MANKMTVTHNQANKKHAGFPNTPCSSPNYQLRTACLHIEKCISNQWPTRRQLVFFIDQPKVGSLISLETQDLISTFFVTHLLIKSVIQSAFAYL